MKRSFIFIMVIGFAFLLVMFVLEGKKIAEQKAEISSLLKEASRLTLEMKEDVLSARKSGKELLKGLKEVDSLLTAARIEYEKSVEIKLPSR